MNKPLSPEQKAQLATALQTRAQQLTQALRAHQGGVSRAEHAAEVLAQDGDDAPQRDADREVDLARSDQATLELAQIARAQQHLSQPDFGVCTDCGAEIGFARLQVEPWAQRCIHCQAALEVRQGGAPAARL